MFSRVVFYILAAFTILAAAIPNFNGHPVTTTVTVTAVSVPLRVVLLFSWRQLFSQPASTATESAGSCNTGPIQCCNSVQKADSSSATALLGLLGIVLQELDVLVGITCTPITVIGAGGSECSASPVCCENNNFVSFPRQIFEGSFWCCE